MTRAARLFYCGFVLELAAESETHIMGLFRFFLTVTVIISLNSGKNTEMLTLSWFNLKWRLCSVLPSAHIFIIDWLIEVFVSTWHDQPYCFLTGKMLKPILQVLYGSQTGSAQDTAHRVARQARRKQIQVQVLPLDSYNVVSAATIDQCM